MTIQYTINQLESLKSTLSTLVDNALWKETSKNAFQARHSGGATITYYATTGKITIQGKEEAASKFEEDVRNLLFSPKLQIEGTIESVADSSGQLGYLSDDFPDNEIVIGLVGAVGVEQKLITDILTDRLRTAFRYQPNIIKISSDVIKSIPNFDESKVNGTELQRINYYMDMGNEARVNCKNNAILAMGASKFIDERRNGGPCNDRRAFIIDSLKNPEEVKYLREVYGPGFYLIGVFSDEKDRKKYLTDIRHLEDYEAENLILRDNDEQIGHGQHTSDTFILSDFFVYIDDSRSKLTHSLYRFLDIIFGNPNASPTVEEYSMFMAFATSLRSADLSRQVGAVITKNNEIIASGTNDVPSSGGGLYWPVPNRDASQTDTENGRDYKRGSDPNAVEKRNIIQNILGGLPENIDKEIVRNVLEKSPIKDIIEFNRAVHAEMEALMMCSRNNISARGTTLYCTTFPCHNCAKHIVAAGVQNVIYIEPYPKSKAIDFHKDSIKLGFLDPENSEEKVYFQPFVGVGPRKFFDLFSMTFGSGRIVKRKDSEGHILKFKRDAAKVKLPLIPLNYSEREKIAIQKFDELINS